MTIPRTLARRPWLLATFAFGWQIFFDFSGYTDMARGVAKLLGIQPDPELQQSLPGNRPW